MRRTESKIWRIELYKKQLDVVTTTHIYENYKIVFSKVTPPKTHREKFIGPPPLGSIIPLSNLNPTHILF